MDEALADGCWPDFSALKVRRMQSQFFLFDCLLASYDCSWVELFSLAIFQFLLTKLGLIEYLICRMTTDQACFCSTSQPCLNRIWKLFELETLEVKAQLDIFMSLRDLPPHWHLFINIGRLQSERVWFTTITKGSPCTKEKKEKPRKPLSMSHYISLTTKVGQRRNVFHFPSKAPFGPCVSCQRESRFLFVLLFLFDFCWARDAKGAPAY